MTRGLFHLPGRDVPVPLRTPASAGEAHSFRATVQRISDGDTIVGDLELGYGGLVARGRPMRFAGGNAREAHGPKKQPGGPEASLNLARVLQIGMAVTVGVVSETADPHRRLLVTVRLDDGTDLIEELIAQQWLAAWDGRERDANGDPPVPPWPRTVA